MFKTKINISNNPLEPSKIIRINDTIQFINVSNQPLDFINFY